MGISLDCSLGLGLEKWSHRPCVEPLPSPRLDRGYAGPLALPQVKMTPDADAMDWVEDIVAPVHFSMRRSALGLGGAFAPTYTHEWDWPEAPHDGITRGPHMAYTRACPCPHFVGLARVERCTPNGLPAQSALDYPSCPA